MATKKQKPPKSQKSKPQTVQPRKPKSDTSEVSEKTLVMSDMSDMSDSLKAQIVQIVRAEVKAMLEGQTVPKLQTELPPLPKEKIKGDKGRKVAPGGRTKIASTLDAELERRFQEWREERGLTLSRALDVAIWNFLGRPPLSFETSKEADKEPDAWSVLHATPEDTYED